MNLTNRNLKQGYSMLEMLITLLVVNILILMLSNILVISLRISLEINERSLVREELTNISNLMKRDIRNANTVRIDCVSGGNTCTVDKGNEVLRWTFCPVSGGSTAPQQICKYRVDPVANTIISLTYQSKSKIDFQTLTFQDAGGGIIPTQSTSQASILITMTADHSSPNLDIKNLYRQVVVSTLNFSY